MRVRLQAAITSWSLTEPPGWMMAAIWALAASSIESGKGKKASLERIREPVGGQFAPSAQSALPARLQVVHRHPIIAKGHLT